MQIHLKQHIKYNPGKKGHKILKYFDIVVIKVTSKLALRNKFGLNN